MIMYGKLDTIRRSCRHLAVMSTAIAALPVAATGCGPQRLPTGPAVGFRATAALLWHAIRERTT
jgi:hypothetical protein